MKHFISKINIQRLRHLENITITLDKEERKHLLLTGKNGSGKTTLLNSIKQYLMSIPDGKLDQLRGDYLRMIQRAEQQLEKAETDNEKFKREKELSERKSWLKKYKDGVEVEFNSADGLVRLFSEGKFILAFYSADRKTGIIKVNNAENVKLLQHYSFEDKPGDILLKYLIHLKTQQAYARNEADLTTVEMLDAWFERFTKALRVLLDNDSIQLKYDYKNYNFQILEDGRNPYGFDQLSDGYSAAIRIVADIILRMEQNWLKEGQLNSYDTEGIVLIDELETHLHIGLQKTTLPFLTTFFPNLQFIVSTHSPYILNSISNSVIYDLENHIRMEDMSSYSAEGIVEAYFEVDLYSEMLINKVNRYRYLVEKKTLSEEERAERALLLSELKQLSGDLSKEARAAFDDIEDRRKQND